MTTEMFPTFLIVADDVEGSKRGGLISMIESQQLLDVYEPILDHLKQISWDDSVIACGIYLNHKWVVHTREGVESLFMNIRDEDMAPQHP